MRAIRTTVGTLLVLGLLSIGQAQVSGVGPFTGDVGGVSQTAAPINAGVTTIVSSPTTVPAIPATPSVPVVLPDGNNVEGSGGIPAPTTPGFTPGASTLTPGAGAGAPVLARMLQINDPRWSGSTNVVNVATARSANFPARLSNVSVRGYVASNSPLIGGGVITGAAALPTFARAAGPTLKLLGVGNPLQWPSLAVYEGSGLAAQTDYVQGALAPVAAYVGAFPSTVGDPLSGMPTDAALAGQPLAGNLTGVCTSADGGAGIALVEFYDASNTPSGTSPRFHNFSGRAQVVSGEGVLIVGFVVAGNGNITLLLRGVGASLARFGITDPLLPDPIIELYHGTTLIATSDNWRADSGTASVLASTASQVGAFPLIDSNESALLITLPAGSYSLQLRDTQGRTGVGLAEIYEVPALAGP